MANKQEFIQQLTLSLRGGQTLVVPFHAEKPNTLNPQIEALMKAMADEKSQNRVIVFNGPRVVVVRVADVSACDVVVLVRQEKKPGEASPAPEAK